MNETPRNTNPQADAESALLRRLEAATAAEPFEEPLDDETAALRETWLRFTALLPPGEELPPFALEPPARRRPGAAARLGLLLAGGLAAALAILWIAPRGEIVEPGVARVERPAASEGPDGGTEEETIVAGSRETEPAAAAESEAWEWSEFDTELSNLSQWVYTAGFDGAEASGLYWRLDSQIQSESELVVEDSL